MDELQNDTQAENVPKWTIGVAGDSDGSVASVATTNAAVTAELHRTHEWRRMGTSRQNWQRKWFVPALRILRVQAIQYANAVAPVAPREKTTGESDTPSRG